MHLFSQTSVQTKTVYSHISASPAKSQKALPQTLLTWGTAQSSWRNAWAGKGHKEAKGFWRLKKQVNIGKKIDKKPLEEYNSSSLWGILSHQCIFYYVFKVQLLCQQLYKWCFNINQMCIWMHWNYVMSISHFMSHVTKGGGVRMGKSGQWCS